MNTLIVAEKPSVALRIAIALGDNKQRRVNNGRAGYYEIDNAGSTTYIAPAVGHLFTIKQAGDKRGYPVLDVEWAPSYEVNKGAAYTKQYLMTLQSLAQKCGIFINACDYDVEGTVIGTNIIMFIIKPEARKETKRMKFSTTTIPELKEAYANLLPIDMNNFYAGEVRHMLDWLWGINFSRALSAAVSAPGAYRALSIGRVQGPTLALLSVRENEISEFVPRPFWKISASINGVEFQSDRGDMFDKAEADGVFRHVSDNAKHANVTKIEKSEQSLWPYPPFDLTSLQLEASRTLRMDPSRTLAVAQSLYEKSYISYPRTSSQRLPPTLGLRRIIGDIAKNRQYSALANILIKSERFTPRQGKKTDEAHPAIYPTGVEPKAMNPEEQRVYDLITKRFLACFAENASVARVSAHARIGDEGFTANGSTITKRGWLDIYDYMKFEDKSVEGIEENATYGSEPAIAESQTKPPRRYGKASLIAELEKRNLGTKATRAAIIDTLYKRTYITGGQITVTSFGMSVYKTLRDNCSMIVDESTTKRLEEDMESIAKGTKSKEEVLSEGKKMLLEALKMFDSNKAKVSESLKTGLKESSVSLGKCPNDGGDLVIKRSKFGKQFVGCDNYPKCTTTYPLPGGAKIIPTGKVCEYCHTPIVKVMRWGKGVFEMDLDPNCVTKKDWASKRAEPKVETGAQLKAKGAASAAKAKPKTAARKAAKKRTATKAKATKPAKSAKSGKTGKADKAGKTSSRKTNRVGIDAEKEQEE